MVIQATSGSQRERWVAAFLPATAILLVGMMYITFSAYPTLTKTENEYASVVSGAVQPFLVQQLKADVERLSNDQDELQEMIRLVDDEVTEKSVTFQQLSPTAKHSAVIALCRQQGVAILQDRSVDSISLPKLRNKSVETLQSLAFKDAVGFRELTLAADYGTIVELLRKLPEIPGVIPVSMTLKKRKVVDSSGDPLSPTVSWKVGLLM